MFLGHFLPKLILLGFSIYLYHIVVCVSTQEHPNNHFTGFLNSLLSFLSSDNLHDVAKLRIFNLNVCQQMSR